MGCERQRRWWALRPGGKEQAAGPHPEGCRRIAGSGLFFLSHDLAGMQVYCCWIPGACFPPFRYPAHNIQDTGREIPEPATAPSLWAVSHRTRSDWRVSQIRFCRHFPGFFCYIFLEPLAITSVPGVRPGKERVLSL